MKHGHYRYPRGPAFPTLLTLLAVAVISGCTVGPDYQKPAPDAPADWTTWRSGNVALHGNVANQAIADGQWWKRYNDPVLDDLVNRALTASPDIRSATLRFAGARAQRGITAAQQLPAINGTAKITREQQSDNGPSTRALKEVLPDPDQLVDLMADPYNWYQTGLNFSWEIDLWGHVRRAVEAANADVEAQRAMLEMARLSIISDVVTNYYTLRGIQQQLSLAQQDRLVLEQRLKLITARATGGAIDSSDRLRQDGELAALQASVIDLQAQESVAINQILVLLGEHPGALRAQLASSPDELDKSALPSLQLGIPSEAALSRPDIRAAEATLHSATARIGVAEAELYPSITLGGRLGFDSYSEGNLAQWGSRTWSVGPSLDLPLFDHGRRKATVTLRETDQQQAAVDYQKTVLKAWQEIDDALSRYTAARQKLQQQQQRQASTGEALHLIDARYQGGLTSFINVLDAQRSHIQARQAVAQARKDALTAWAAVNRAVGNYPR